ncbi:MAG: hypothetical protein KDC92_15745 [Bacteroidetes bacterium]|nr:hypothetical protein [Bacteroidota bacterium]
MISIFRKLRRRWFADGRFSRYLLYAMGEVFLVVVGILIAVQINNWNEQRKFDKETSSILRRVAQDLIQDTMEVSISIEAYSFREEYFANVIDEKVERSDYTSNPIYPSLIVTMVPFTIDKMGYTQLLEHKSNSDVNVDSLVNKVSSFYNAFNVAIDESLQRIGDDVFNNFNYWKGNTDWFWSFIENKPIESWYNYVLNETDYKNRVAFHKTLVIGNHLEILKQFKAGATQLLNDIEKRIN